MEEEVEEVKEVDKEEKKRGGEETREFNARLGLTSCRCFAKIEDTPRIVPGLVFYSTKWLILT